MSNSSLVSSKSIDKNNNLGGSVEQPNLELYNGRYRLAYHEQEGCFNHLISIIKGAVSYKQLKTVWLERNKLEAQFEKEYGVPCWIMSKFQNDIILEAYNDRKTNEFATEVANELAERESVVEYFKSEIVKCETIDQLREVNKAIYKEVKHPEFKKPLIEMATKAYQELLKLTA